MTRTAASQAGGDGEHQKNVDAEGGTGALLVLQDELAVELRQHDEGNETYAEKGSPTSVPGRLRQGVGFEEPLTKSRVEVRAPALPHREATLQAKLAVYTRPPRPYLW